jgi:ATP-binding cassette subfamily C protein CydC
MKTPWALLPLRERWRTLLLGLGLLLLTLGSGLALLVLSGWFITASAMAGLGLIAMINIFTPGAAIRMAALTRTLARYAERLATHAATLRLLTSLRMEVFSRLIRQPSLFLERLQRGDALNRLTADIDTLDHVYLGVFQPAAGALLLTLLIIVLVAPASPSIAFGVLLPLLLINLLIVWSSHRAGRAASQDQARAYPALRQDILDGLEARLELRALGQVDRFADQIAEQSHRLLARGRHLAVIDAVGGALIVLVNLSALVLCLRVGLSQLDEARAAGPLLAALILGLFAISEAWLSLPAAWRRLHLSRVAAERVASLCPEEGTAAEVRADPAAWPTAPDLSFKQLRFAWAEHQPPLFDGLDLEIPKGQRLALVGPSGCGKTTLLRLIMGQLRPQQGQVRIGGIDVRRFTAAALQQHIAYLPQNPVLFRDTVAGNLRLAREDASDDELVEALARAGLEEWLEGLPLGLNTWLDEAAANLSGGERRRLTIARMFLGGGEIVLLDEPTASLDDQKLESLNRSLDRWLAGRTAIIVTHRAEALVPVDRTLALQ